MTTLDEAALEAAEPQVPLRKRAWMQMRKKYVGTISGIILLVFIFVAIFAPLLAPYDPIEPNTAERLAGVSASHLLGTDELGRDVFSRILVGARASLFVGFVSTLMGAAVGTVFGISSAYFGGKYDLVVQRFVDALQAFPGLVMAMALVAVLGASLWNVTLAIMLSTVAIKTRVARSGALAVMASPYVEGARIGGCSDFRIMTRYVLPNAMAPILVSMSISLGGAILAESSLSFLGLGPPPPAPTWGSMMSGSARSYIQMAPWLALAPGIAITVVVLSFNLFGDMVRDLLDPRLRGL